MSDLKARRLLCTVDFRNLTPLEKAVKLVQNHEISQRCAGRVCKRGRRAIQCALKSSKKGDPIGVRGRHKIFNREEEEVLIAAVDEAELNQAPLSFKQLQDKV